MLDVSVPMLGCLRRGEKNPSAKLLLRITALESGDNQQTGSWTNGKQLDIAEVRSRIGVTQQVLADMLNVDRKYISMIETGAKPLSKKLAKKLILIDKGENQKQEVEQAQPETYAESCSQCALLKKELVEARAVIRDLASALAAKSTTPPTEIACDASCSAGKRKRRKEA